MTIAACHLSPEGVVLGTDSTSTITRSTAGGSQTWHHDYEQKVFEVGPPASTVGLATWGMGRIGNLSHRTIAAQLGARHRAAPFVDVGAMAEYLAAEVDGQLKSSLPDFTRAADLFARAMDPVNPQALPDDEMKFVLRALENWSGGYFIAGRVSDALPCEAFEVRWSVAYGGANTQPLDQERPHFRGIPHIMQRLVLGYDEDLPHRVLNSGKWTGTPEELIAVLEASNFQVRPELLPLRDAVDWIHTVIHTTIRANKFSGWHFCGGPVEIAAITTDRPFRWVCHKGLDAAIITAQEGLRR